jgi:hypothetical protein
LAIGLQRINVESGVGERRCDCCRLVFIGNINYLFILLDAAGDKCRDDAYLFRMCPVKQSEVARQLSCRKLGLELSTPVSWRRVRGVRVTRRGL